MKIGCARVGATDQNPYLQIDALKSTVYEMIFKEKISGKSKVIKIDFDIIHPYICKLLMGFYMVWRQAI